MTDSATDTPQTTPTEYPLHPRFYKILNIPPCPLSKVEMAYHLRNYLERVGALVTTDDDQEQYILVNKDISILSGLDKGDTFTLREAGRNQHSYADFSRLVWGRVRLSR
jgi:hypothetical protein